MATAALLARGSVLRDVDARSEARSDVDARNDMASEVVQRGGWKAIVMVGSKENMAIYVAGEHAYTLLSSKERAMDPPAAARRRLPPPPAVPAPLFAGWVWVSPAPLSLSLSSKLTGSPGRPGPAGGAGWERTTGSSLAGAGARRGGGAGKSGLSLR